jgi:hypothetical protein
MRRRECQRQLAVAERRLAVASTGLHASMTRLRTRIDRHGPIAVLGAGAASGAVAGMLPLGGVARIARGLASVGLLLLRVPARAWIAASRMHNRPQSKDSAP